MASHSRRRLGWSSKYLSVREGAASSASASRVRCLHQSTGSTG